MTKALNSRILVILWIFASTLCVFGAPSSKAADLETVCSEVESHVKEGDLVFVEIGNKLFENVAKTQGHWASHIGVALKDQGQWVVAESTIPFSKMTPLCQFVKKGYQTHLTLKRYKKELSQNDLDRLHSAAIERMGILYHTGFKLHSNRLFCSKFVDQIFEQAIGINVGKTQTFKELLEKSPHPEVTNFWKWWFYGFIPWSRETLTPASQVQDNQFDEVFSYSAAN